VRGLLIPGDPGTGWDPAAPYRLDPDVALRPEPFGALAYHYGSRRLTFLRSPLLAELVRRLGDFGSVDAALDELVPEAQHPAFRKALGSLADSHFIRTGQ
jgi:putative mycofactocin binding protein MftB